MIFETILLFAIKKTAALLYRMKLKAFKLVNTFESERARNGRKRKKNWL